MLDTFSTWPVVWQALAATIFTWGLTAIGAGAVFFFKEVIPESQRGGNSDLATLGAMVGFAAMMTLDVALG